MSLSERLVSDEVGPHLLAVASAKAIIVYAHRKREMALPPRPLLGGMPVAAVCPGAAEADELFATAYSAAFDSRPSAGD